MNTTPNELPPGWAPNTDVAAVIAQIEKRMHRLRQIDCIGEKTAERVFLYGVIAQLIKTGHS